MTLRRAAFPHQIGYRTFDVYLLWLDDADLAEYGGLLRPLLADNVEELERIVEADLFQKTLAHFLPGAKVEFVPTAFDSFYVRVLIRRRYKASADTLPVRSIPSAANITGNFKKQVVCP